MVGNFREGFKLLLSTCKASETCFNPAYFKLSSRPNSNRTLSVRVSLTAIAQAIQEIEVLRKHRHAHEMDGARLRAEAIVSTNVLTLGIGYFFRYTGTNS